MHLNEMQGSLGNDVELLNEINKSKMWITNYLNKSGCCQKQQKCASG
jgi:hypothetical protein